jgi:hypothetical protein
MERIIEMSEKKLETVDERNARIQASRKAREEEMSRTGVACPKCGKEMLWVPFAGCTPNKSLSLILTSMPPKREGIM